MAHLVAFLMMVVLLSLGTYFFNADKLGGGTYATFVIGILVIFIAFYSLDRLKEFNITGMKLILTEM